ncbi:transposase [Streptomyces niveiscabiei]|uniref:transposase n=1 Tax=Streptomyces niveiscabiei TaxID=164115 RepID=UPI00389AAECC
MAAPHKYPDEPRERAVREVQAAGRPVVHAAKDLGIHKEALRGWVRQAEAGPRRAGRAEATPQGKGGVEAGERDPQGCQRVFCPGDRPSPDEAEPGVPPREGVIGHLRERGLGVGLPQRGRPQPAGSWRCRRRRTSPARSGRSRPAGYAVNSSCR